jgi:hypothetical protein
MNFIIFQDSVHPNLTKKIEKLKMRNKFLQNLVRKQQSLAETSMNRKKNYKNFNIFFY